MSGTALDGFLARFDELRGTVTDPVPVRRALAAAGLAAAKEPFALSAVHGNLRTPEVAVLGGSGGEPFRERRVANRRLPGYADPDTLAHELRHGAALLVERPDLRSDALRQGLAGLDDALDAGRLSCYLLYLEPRSQTLRFDCGQVSRLVTQLAGETAWEDSIASDGGAGTDGGSRKDGGAGTDGGSRKDGGAGTDRGGELVAGGSRHLPAGVAPGTVSCRPLSPTVLLVLAYREPDRRHLQEVLAERFLARLRESGAAERHHLVAAEDKADWLRDQLVAELTGPTARARLEGLDLLPEARPPVPTVVHAVPRAGKGGTARTSP